MAIDRIQICHRLSPSTLLKQWHRNQYTSSSWRVSMLKLSGILFACSLETHAIIALILYAVGLGCMRLYYTTLNETHFVIFEMHEYGLNEIMRINREVMRTVLQSERSKSFRDRGLLTLMNLEGLRSTNDALKQGPFGNFTPDPDTTDRNLETILSSFEIFKGMSNDMKWLQAIEARLSQFTKQYISILRALFALPREKFNEQLGVIVNDYATYVLRAMEHPFEPLEQAA